MSEKLIKVDTVEIKKGQKLDIYINGVPDINLMPKEELDLFCKIMEPMVTEMAEKSAKRRKYYKKSKEKTEG